MHFLDTIFFNYHQMSLLQREFGVTVCSTPGYIHNANSSHFAKNIDPSEIKIMAIIL